MSETDRYTDANLSCMLSPTFSSISICVHVIVCSATIFGNILILVTFYKFPTHFKGTLYMLIGNLAIADLLLGLWLLLFIYEEIVPEVEQNWYFCVAKPVGILISYCCSVFTLLWISFDCFMAVIFPMQHLVNTQKRKFFTVRLIVVWIVSIIIGSLPTILPNMETPRKVFLCRMGAIIPQDFNFASSICLLLIVFVNISLYGIIMWKIKTKETPGHGNGRKKETNAVLMMIVFVLFLVCWLPFIICSFLMQANLAPSSFQNILCAREYLAKLGFVHSALNWVIYGVANRKFRLAFRKILYCKSCTCLQKPLSLSAHRSGAKSMHNKTRCSVDQRQNIEHI